MAFTCSLLCHFVVFLLAQLTHSTPIQVIKNHSEHNLQPSNTYFLLARPSHLVTLEHWYTSMVATTHSPRVEISSNVLYTGYDTVMHGLAVQLNGDEAGRMSNCLGVYEYEDRLLHPQTTRSPGFLRLDPGFSARRYTDFGGDSVITVFVDTGIWPENRRFSRSELGPVRPTWRNSCVDGDFHAILSTTGGVFFQRNEVGYGTLLASTAAGLVVTDGSLYKCLQGTERSMPPKARTASDPDGYNPTVKDHMYIIVAMAILRNRSCRLLALSILACGGPVAVFAAGGPAKEVAYVVPPPPPAAAMAPVTTWPSVVVAAAVLVGVVAWLCYRRRAAPADTV